MLGTESLNFHQLEGDYNGDLGTSIFDFGAIVTYFGLAVPDQAPEFLDLNLDGGVSIFDFGVWLNNFGRVITPAP